MQTAQFCVLHRCAHPISNSSDSSVKVKRPKLSATAYIAQGKILDILSEEHDGEDGDQSAVAALHPFWKTVEGYMDGEEQSSAANGNLIDRLTD